MWPVHISALFVFHTALCSSEKLPFWFVILTSVIIRQNFFTSRFSRILTMYMSEDKEDAMDRCKWRKMIKDVQWSGWVWVGECFFWYRPTRVVPRVVPDKRPLNGCVCVCVCVCVCTCQKLPPHIHCIATLLCEIWNSNLMFCSSNAISADVCNVQSACLKCPPSAAVQFCSLLHHSLIAASVTR